MLKPTIRTYGRSAILFEWAQIISEEINDAVIDMLSYLEENYRESIQEIVPSYQSLVVYLREDVDEKKILTDFQKIESISSIHLKKKLWKIPVCYDDSFGIDLKDLAELHQLSEKEIIEIHCQSSYRIFGIGFLPGFLYLGNLDQRLHTPRRRAVNRFATKGAVAIGGQQTGIYPQESPGGWNIIGRTPIELFDPKIDPPSPFSMGDSLQFYPINPTKFKQLETEIAAGTFTLKPIFQ